MDSNHRRRKPADLQSAPFGHSGNYPVEIKITNAHRSAIPISSAKVGINLKPTNFSAIFFRISYDFPCFLPTHDEPHQHKDPRPLQTYRLSSLHEWYAPQQQH